MWILAIQTLRKIVVEIQKEKEDNTVILEEEKTIEEENTLESIIENEKFGVELL